MWRLRTSRQRQAFIAHSNEFQRLSKVNQNQSVHQAQAGHCGGGDGAGTGYDNKYQVTHF